ncbi:signal recognition particle-docking protein FtsY [Shewanella amazonensis]|nr:signal recognition particle-docking protein FtsY [Shewanella amazonensis]
MSKKGFFSWFRRDKDDAAAKQAEAEHAIVEQVQAESAAAEQAEREAAEQAAAEVTRLEAEQLEAERIAAEQAEQERIAAEQAAAEAARLEAERQEEARLAAEQLEAERIAAEQAEQERIAAEQAAAEAARLEAERQKEARLAAEQLEAERIAAEQAEQERIAAEQAAAEAARLEAERQEEARLAAEQLEAERIAAEQAEQERIAAEQSAAEAASVQTEQAEEVQPEPQAKPVKEGFFARLKRGLMRTSENIGSGFIGLFRGKKIDDELFEELEEQLLIADVGVETTSKLIKSLTEHASRRQLKDAEALYELLREEMQRTLEPVSVPLVPENAQGPYVILMVGVNGVGKTTTIGKLAKQYQSQGKSVMLAAGDTFRAAAVEQLQVWGQRNNIPVVAQHTGADSASVLFDALQSAKAKGVDVLICDTAGRLQNKNHLMEELKKVVRVMKKLDESAPHEVMLTLDASTGQNAISQAKLFQEAVGVTGISITKLDGTAKGGVIFAIADKFGIPIRYIGVGEQIDDLRVFNARDFIDALFSQEKTDNT